MLNKPQLKKKGYPATLHKGEVVLDEDTVRYHGLKTIMGLREKAEKGRAELAKEGQVKDPSKGHISAATGGLIQPLSQQKLNELYPPSGGFINPPTTTGVIDNPDVEALIDEEEDNTPETPENSTQNAPTVKSNPNDALSDENDGTGDVGDVGVSSGASAGGSSSGNNSSLGEIGSVISDSFNDVSTTDVVAGIATAAAGPVAGLAVHAVDAVVSSFSSDTQGMSNPGVDSASDVDDAVGPGASAQGVTDTEAIGNTGQPGGQMGQMGLGAEGDGEGGESDSVICTYLYGKGLIDKDLFEAEVMFGRQVSDFTLSGYHKWSRPFVKLLRKANSKLLDRVILVLTKPVMKVIAKRLSWDGIYGIPVFLVGSGICTVIGVVNELKK